jgi:hypothetical protein
MKVILTLSTIVALSFGLPNVSYTVYGAAQMDARVGDVISVPLVVEDIDAGVSELEIAVPYPDTVQYKGAVADAYTGGTLTGEDGEGEVVISWAGELPVGATARLGHIKFTVLKADRSVYMADGQNATALDANGLALDTVVETSGASVRLLPRPLRILLDLVVEPQ